MDLRPETPCPVCGSVLVVKKTVTRQVKTPSGVRKVRERVCACPAHGKLIRHPPITPPRSPYTFDLIAGLGMLRYLQHRQISEICSLMETGGVHIPSRTANRLCRLFLRYFTAVHIESAPAIRALLKRQRGYVLILDGTGHHGPMVMQMRDRWSGMQLLDNLKNGVYVREVYGSISNMPKRFSTVSQKSPEDAKKILQCSGTNE